MGASAERARDDSPAALRRVLAGQTLVGLVLATFFWAVFGTVAGYSALAGGLICVIPNAFLALRLIMPRRDPGAHGLLRAAYAGELGKILLTVLMFSLAFMWIDPLAAGPLFATFIAAQLATFAGLLRTAATIDKQAD